MSIEHCFEDLRKGIIASDADKSKEFHEIVHSGRPGDEILGEFSPGTFYN